MKEEMQNALMGLLTQAIEAAQKGAEFLAGELPDVIQQLLLWKLLDALYFPFGWLLPMFVCLVIAYANRNANKAWKEARHKLMTHEGDWREYTMLKDRLKMLDDARSWVIYPLCGVFFFASLSFIAFMIKGSTIFLLIYAPKVYLLQYGASLFK